MCFHFLLSLLAKLRLLKKAGSTQVAGHQMQIDFDEAGSASHRLLVNCFLLDVVFHFEYVLQAHVPLLHYYFILLGFRVSIQLGWHSPKEKVD
jgi:hypothetical protein